MKPVSLLTLSLGGLICLSSIQAQTSSSTPPIGFIRKDCPANSDTRLSIPLERQSVFIGPITEPTGSLITTQGNPGWTADEFKFNASTQTDTFYVLFLSGAKAGRNFTITSNTQNTLTVDLDGDTLSDVNEGDRIKLLPYWNLDKAFPNGDGAATSQSAFNIETEVLFLNNSSPGINFGVQSSFFFLNSAWNQIGGAGNGNQLLLPHEHVIIRNKDTATSPVFVGVVPSDIQTAPLRVPQGSGYQDNHISLNRPVPVKLRDSDLVSSGAFKSSTPFFLGDQLLVFSDSDIALNKSASAVYFYDTAWRLIGADLSEDQGDAVIFEAGTGVIIRKKGEGAGSEEKIFWTHDDPTND